MEARWFVYVNTTGYLKNHWTKHRLVCTHFDAFSMLIPNMGAKCNNFEIFKQFSAKLWCSLHVMVTWQRVNSM